MSTFTQGRYYRQSFAGGAENIFMLVGEPLKNKYNRAVKIEDYRRIAGHCTTSYLTFSQWQEIPAGSIPAKLLAKMHAKREMV